MALAAVAVSGCAPQHKDAIMFGVNTTGGLKVGVDEKQVPTVIIGYNRQEAALVPLFVYGDGMFKAADRNLDSTTYLELAMKRFEGAKASTSPDNTRLFNEGVALVQRAYAAVPQESGEISPGLHELNSLAGTSRIADLDTFRLLTEAEIQRPSTAVRYLQEYKYMAEVNKAGRRDAYSVLGTFTGGAKGKAKTTGINDVEASGSIAQYFATGMAAQNLSRQPASVNTNASAIKASYDATITGWQRRNSALEYMTNEASFLKMKSVVSDWWAHLSTDMQWEQIDVIAQWAHEHGVSVDPLLVSGESDPRVLQPKRLGSLLDSLVYNETSRLFLADIIRNAVGIDFPN